MGTGISDKQESSYFFLCYPGRQASEFPFSTEELAAGFSTQVQDAPQRRRAEAEEEAERDPAAVCKFETCCTS